MWRIARSNDGHRKTISPANFGRDFLSICKQHLKEKRALAFGFILHRVNDPHVGIILEDPNYWAALDSLSGKYLTIYSFVIEPSPSRVREPAVPYVVREMVGVETHFGPDRTAISTHFAGIDLEKQPCVLFFGAKNGHVADPFAIRIRSDLPETTFLELQDVLGRAVRAVQKVTPDNAGNSTEILGLIRSELATRDEEQAAIAIGRFVRPIAVSVAVKILRGLMSGHA